MRSESETRGLDPNTTLELGLEDVQLFDRLEDTGALAESEAQMKAAAAPDAAASGSKEQDCDPNTTLELTLDDLEVEDSERPA